MLFLNFLGAIGLFLLGMWLMTEGLKLAGGKALEHLLKTWTSSKPRGLAAGVLITALVQSSSAVIIATIGFVNAGLMSFTQSVWVVFGSSLGTTLTSWLITLFGFNLNIGLAASPLIAFGAFLRVFSPFERGRYLGMALAGFGLLFMGIDAMKATFSIHAQALDLTSLIGDNSHTVLIGLGIGFVLTLLTQSSSAAIAIILTASASQLAGFEVAAAAVVGANIGTTSTSIIATLGATASAKRLALSHVLFNGSAGAIGLLFLPLLVATESALTLQDSAISQTLLLAMFHTLFNLLGIFVMIPCEPYITRFLSTLYRKVEQKHNGKQHYIDRNVAEIPDLALRALQLELQQLYQQVQNQSMMTVIYNPTNPLDALKLEEIISDVSHFIVECSQANLTRQQSSNFTAGLAVSHYLHNSYQTLNKIRDIAPIIQRLDHQLVEALNEWLEKSDTFTKNISFDEKANLIAWQPLLEDYINLKKRLLASAIGDHQRLTDVDNALLLASLSKRYVEQLLQAVVPLEKLLPQEMQEENEVAASDVITPPAQNFL